MRAFDNAKYVPRNACLCWMPGPGQIGASPSTIDAFLRLLSVLRTGDESTLSLKDLLEDPKLKDYIVNSFLPLAPDATLADAKDLLDKIPNVSISWLHKTELRMA